MKIVVIKNVRLTNLALNALIEATNIQVKEGFLPSPKKGMQGRVCFWVAGQRFFNRGQVCRYLIEECNNWMIACGLVKLDIIKNAGDSTGYKFFDILD